MTLNPSTAERKSHTNATRRSGGVYIVVLGVSLIVSLLGLSALVVQRIQNKLLVASTDIRQAQLNAESAVGLALLTMKQDTAWRTSQTNGNWFTNRSLGTGTGSVSVTDPVDGSLSNNADQPVVIQGIGYRGQAEQRVEATIDPKHPPLSCLRSAIAAGDTIDLSSDTLRTDGLITANTMTAASSSVYGSVQAVSATGSTYNGTNTTVTSDKRPTMPTWSTVFDYYKTNGTEISIGSLPTTTGSPPGYLGRNVGIESSVSSSDWTGTPTGIPTADINQSNNYNHTSGGNNSLRVRNRLSWYSGPAQSIDGYVKSGQQYYVEAWVYMPSGIARTFQISIYTKGSGTAQLDSSTSTLAIVGLWTKIFGNVTAPAWSGNLEYAFLKIGGGDTSNTADFYADDLVIRETTTGSFIYRQALGPGYNPFGASTNANGLYWIDCANNKLVIERSRIRGTLLVINPGANSCVGPGPIRWSPALAGYPALMVKADTADNADFSIQATNRILSEKENGVNYNPSGVPHEDFGTDADTSDIYQSQIRGLVVVQDDLTYQNRSLIRGSVLFGDDLTGASGTLEVEYQPDALLNPPPGFFAPYTYSRRPISVRKTVVP